MAKTITITARAFALLARPVTGQGGYQSRLRNLQAELGIEPDESLQGISPGSYNGPMEMSAPVVKPVAPVKSKRDQLVDKLMAVLGLNDESETVQVPARRQTDRMTLAEPESETDYDSEADLQATLAKALRVRQEKAVLHSIGRTRKSPKLSTAERERRSARMTAMWVKARKVASTGKVARKVSKGKGKGR